MASPQGGPASFAPASSSSSASTSTHPFPPTTSSSIQQPSSSSSSRQSSISGPSYAPPQSNGAGPSSQQRVVAPPSAPSSTHQPSPASDIFEGTLCKYILIGPGRGCYGALFETRKAALSFVKSNIKSLSGVEDRKIEFLIDSCPVLEGIWCAVMRAELARGTGYLEISIEVEQEEEGEEGGFEVQLLNKKAKLSHPAPPTQLAKPLNPAFSKDSPFTSQPLPHQPPFIPRPAHYPPLASSQTSQFFRQPSISSHSHTSSTASNPSDPQSQPRRTSQPSQSRQPSLTSSRLSHPVQQPLYPPSSSHQPIPHPSLPYTSYHPPPGLSFSPTVVFQQPFEPPRHSSSSSSRPNPSSNDASSSQVSLPDGWTGSSPNYASASAPNLASAQTAKGLVADGHGGEGKKEKKQRKPSPYNHFYAIAYPRVKLARPDLENAEIIREVAKQWAEEPENPKNIKANRRDDRQPTLYSEFYTVEYAREKALHPEISFEDRNRTVAELWAESPRNPRNFLRDRDASTIAAEAHAKDVALMAIQAVNAAAAGNGEPFGGDESEVDGAADGMGEVDEGEGGEEGGES